MTKHAVFPQIQYIDKVIAVLIARQRQIPQTQAVRKTGSPAGAVHQQCGHACDHQPGDQACQDSADSIFRRSCGVATTGPSVSDCTEYRGSPAVAVHRQVGAAGDQPDDQACRDSAVPVRQQVGGRASCDTATGPSDTDGFKDCGSTEPVHPFQEENDETIKLFPVERIPERNGDHIVDVLVPLTMEEAAEITKEEYHALLKSIVEKYSTW